MLSKLNIFVPTVDAILDVLRMGELSKGVRIRELVSQSLDKVGMSGVGKLYPSYGAGCFSLWR